VTWRVRQGSETIERMVERWVHFSALKEDTIDSPGRMNITVMIACMSALAGVLQDMPLVQYLGECDLRIGLGTNSWCLVLRCVCVCFRINLLPLKVRRVRVSLQLVLTRL